MKFLKAVVLVTAFIGAGIWMSGSADEAPAAPPPAVLATQGETAPEAVVRTAQGPRTPAPSDSVLLFDSRKMEWKNAIFDERLAPGDEVLFQGHLYRLVQSGKLQHRGEATVAAFASADETPEHFGEDLKDQPGQHDWVYVLGGSSEEYAGHLKFLDLVGMNSLLASGTELEDGPEYLFQGRLYTSKRSTEGLESVLASGSGTTLTATPEHPFYVPEHDAYISLGDLEIGTKFLASDGKLTILVSKTHRDGEFEVFNIEVDGPHNYYVRGPGSDGPGILVHNKPMKLPLTKSQQKSIDSLKQRAAEHRQKLADYKADPDAFDNKGHLKNAPSEEIREKIIDSRVKHLEQEIKTFEDNIRKVYEEAAGVGE